MDYMLHTRHRVTEWIRKQALSIHPWTLDIENVVYIYKIYIYMYIYIYNKILHGLKKE